MEIFTRDGLVDMLRHNVVSVTFTKIDGSKREMRCTLLPEHIPNASTNNGEVILNEKASKTNNISVWDVDKNAWRSFRVEHVISISVG